MSKINSLLLIDKPTGVTSHDVVNMVRRRLHVKRVGHAGTLDPLATGLLIILVGREATKHQSDFLHLNKVYECEAEYGFETDTYDRDGQVIKKAEEAATKKITATKIKNILKTFEGDIQQRVPAFSAVKIQGQKLYQKARHEHIQEKDLPVRNVKIFEIKLLQFNKVDRHFTFSVKCSSGTYIRSLVHDIGKQLGVGATVMELRRTQIGDDMVDDAKSIDQI